MSKRRTMTGCRIKQTSKPAYCAFSRQGFAVCKDARCKLAIGGGK